MKRFLVLLLLLMACSPTGGFNDHQGCKVPAVFDQHAQEVLETLKEAKVAHTFDFVGVERGRYIYRYPGKTFSNGQTMVVRLKFSPEDHGYRPDPRFEGSEKRYVNQETGGVWTERQDQRGLTLSHTCL